MAQFWTVKLLSKKQYWFFSISAYIPVTFRVFQLTTLHSIGIALLVFSVSCVSTQYLKLHEYTKMDIALEQHHCMCVLDAEDKKQCYVLAE